MSIHFNQYRTSNSHSTMVTQSQTNKYTVYSAVEANSKSAINRHAKIRVKTVDMKLQRFNETWIDGALELLLKVKQFCKIVSAFEKAGPTVPADAMRPRRLTSHAPGRSKCYRDAACRSSLAAQSDWGESFGRRNGSQVSWRQ